MASWCEQIRCTGNYIPKEVLVKYSLFLEFYITRLPNFNLAQVADLNIEHIVN